MGFRYRYSEEEEESCDGVRNDCEGCALCVKEVRHVSVHVARKTRKDVLLGDKIEVTTGFDYQVGGPRTGYISRTRVIGFGPNRPPVLVGKDYYQPPFALPLPAQKRDELRARWYKISIGSWDLRGEAALTKLQEEARALLGEIEGFLAEHEEYRKVLTGHITPGGTSELLKRIQERLASAQKAAEQDALKKLWEATGFRANRDAGFRVTWQGQEYILTAEWTRWVARSNMEYMGESVDGSVVWGRELLNPETGKVALLWRGGWDCPRPV